MQIYEEGDNIVQNKKIMYIIRNVSVTGVICRLQARMARGQ